MALVFVNHRVSSPFVLGIFIISKSVFTRIQSFLAVFVYFKKQEIEPLQKPIDVFG